LDSSEQIFYIEPAHRPGKKKGLFGHQKKGGEKTQLFGLKNTFQILHFNASEERTSRRMFEICLRHNVRKKRPVSLGQLVPVDLCIVFRVVFEKERKRTE
jgi:hypothetical protein